MAEVNKTFEFHYEVEDKKYSVKGIVASFDCNEEASLENLNLDRYKDSIYNVSLVCEPVLNLEIFKLQYPVVYIIGYNEKEGQLGYIIDKKFIPDQGENDLVDLISASILEVLLINGDSGHFVDQ
ncbi:hypothetical protein [Sphingobacterium kitahiroshimense]|uniref:Uncharacterized protein n=1 Tax=Sphingobacterium kitahiroshimense TaxID=470446 RepID=A0ABV0C1E8_9SPHI